MAFDVMEYKTPFSDESKKNIVGYNYVNDMVSELKPRLNDLPASLYHSLYNFQKVGVQFGIDHFGRIILGDEMGVGKTIQAHSRHLMSKMTCLMDLQLELQHGSLVSLALA